MAKTLLTGATGFIGSHVARALARRGDELRVLVRPDSSLEGLEGIDFHRVKGDVTDRRSVRRAVKDTERVFHMAGLTSLRSGDSRRLFDVNVTGTRNVLAAALEAGVEKVVYTSSVVAIGPASPGGAATEDAPFRAGELSLAYVNSKHEAEVEAMRLAAQGLPLICLNPAFVIGPGERPGRSMSLVRRFMLGRIPAYVDGALNIVDVRDVAKAHLLADRKGKVGERYILAGRNFTLDRLFADLSRITGLEAPIKLPARAALGLARTAEALSLPAPVSAEEVRFAMQWWTYRNTKARRELGFSPRPHEETLEAAVAWHRDQLGDGQGATTSAAMLPLRAIGVASRIFQRT